MVPASTCHEALFHCTKPSGVPRSGSQGLWLGEAAPQPEGWGPGAAGLLPSPLVGARCLGDQRLLGRLRESTNVALASCAAAAVPPIGVSLGETSTCWR